MFIHFPDRSAVIDALVAEQLALLNHRMDIDARTVGPDQLHRLHALCTAYTSYAGAYPAHYRILVGRFIND